mmetsp:Transcript_33990/g.68485  ORF Transcript_33990/g.68485 Transcript_33990/m.68485 type:complete len:471 (-) Transcript_33990:143-1555(-)
MPSGPSTIISDEVAELRRILPRVEIASATDAFVSGSYQRTPHTKIRMILTFPDGYPTRPLIVDVQSCSVVPPGLKKKLEKDLGKVASDVAGNSDSSDSQVCAVFSGLVSFVDSNKFVPCWRELKQSIDIVNEQGGKVAINEGRGKINITLTSQKYFYKFSIVVDDGYPTTLDNINYGKACRLKMESTNFPPKIEKLLTSQAMELIKRMQDGMPTEDALKMSNPVRLPKELRDEQSKDNVPTVRLTQDALKGLKHDVETLNLVRDLRDVDAATKRGDARVKTHDKKERRDARRTIGKITRHELDDDRARDEKEKQWQLEEKARIAGYNFNEFDGSNPQPSLLAVITFLTNEVKRLTSVKCPICSKLALPAEPNDLKALYLSHSDAKTEKEKKARRMAKLQRPERVYCGCWYHHKCLDRFITEPPFGAECATDGCSRRVYHGDWPADIKELERAWAGKQARVREIEDAGMFL